MKIWTWKFKQNLTHECSNQLINLYLHKLMGLYEALLPPLKSYLLFFSLFCTTFRKIFIKMRVWTTFIPPPLPPPFNAFHFCLHFEFVWSPLILKNIYIYYWCEKLARSSSWSRAFNGFFVDPLLQISLILRANLRESYLH